MGNLHRIAWLDSRIRSGRYPNGRELAEQFEISVRQAQRDIEYLKYTMGAPLEYSAIRKGYGYSDTTFSLPSAMITEEEKRMLSYMANRYRTTGGSDARRLASLFERLTSGGSSEEEYRNLPLVTVGPEEAGIFQVLSEARKKRIKVKMVYENSEGAEAERVFHPYSVFFREQAGYVSGFCEKRQEIRVFRLSRIRKLVLQEETFEIPPCVNPDYHEQNHSFLFRKPYVAILEMDAPPDREGGPVRWNHVSGREYQVEFYVSEELLKILLTAGYSFRILSPNWLRERLKRRLDNIYQKNFT